MVPVTKVSASLPAGETDAVPELLEIATGAGENDTVLALSERVSGGESDIVPTMFEIDAARVSKRCTELVMFVVSLVLESSVVLLIQQHRLQVRMRESLLCRGHRICACQGEGVGCRQCDNRRDCR